ncbi:LysE family translocator [Providencia rettgeri]|uniref:LysE family translocator n=1 Tax=Providencia sp. PROV148 TaxID=2949858 RepID=UPI00234B6DEE|nr:LysE family translocator [Providencia sp. PROV148]EJD6474387.1 LysE family translocator [Providencia rettgeri]ELR5065857.1 LysE family translocator [Providencia rettgeri]ELR5163080.1 LysE family translocator [Providencia rettgeri]
MDILGFIVILFPIVVSPGASFAIALNSVLNQGIRGLFIPIIGTGLGILTHGFLVGIGLSKILVSYQWVMNLIGILGTLYLLYLATSLIISGINASKRESSQEIKKITVKDAYLANLLNPKAIILYLVVVSKYARADPSLANFLVLSLIHIIMMALWLLFSCSALIISSSSLSASTLRKYINIGGGVLLLAITLEPYFFR